MPRCPKCDGTICTSSSSSSSSSAIPTCVRLIQEDPEVVLAKLMEVTKQRDEAYAFIGELPNQFSKMEGTIEKLNNRMGKLESEEKNSFLSQPDASSYENEENLILAAHYQPTHASIRKYPSEWAEDQDHDDILDSDMEEAARATTKRLKHHYSHSNITNAPAAAFPRMNAMADVDDDEDEDGNGAYKYSVNHSSKDVISGYVNGVKKSKSKPRNLHGFVMNIHQQRMSGSNE